MNLCKNLIIAAYLVIQIAVPLRGLLRSKLETRGNFSWNMYANRYGCEVDYVLRRPDGTTEHIDYRRFFRLPRRASMVFTGDTLPHFHTWLCDRFRRDGVLGEIHANVVCSLNEDPPERLVDPNVDICAADSRGMARP